MSIVFIPSEKRVATQSYNHDFKPEEKNHPQMVMKALNYTQYHNLIGVDSFFKKKNKEKMISMRVKSMDLETFNLKFHNISSNPN